jgi:hypothetical protein
VHWRNTNNITQKAQNKKKLKDDRSAEMSGQVIVTSWQNQKQCKFVIRSILIKFRFVVLTVVFQNTTLVLLQQATSSNKSINTSYLQKQPKIKHGTFPAYSSLVQGQAVLGFLHLGLQPVSSYIV